MTGAQLVGYIIAAAGLVGALVTLFTKVIRPAIRGFTRLLSLLDQLLEVLNAWPSYQALAVAHSSDITDLAGQIGELRVTVGKLATDLADVMKKRRPAKKAAPARRPRNASPVSLVREIPNA